VQAEAAIVPDDSPAALGREGGEPHPVAVEPVGKHEGVPGEAGHGGPRPGEFGRGRIRADIERPAQAAPHIVDGEETPREHHRPLGPEELQAVGNGREPRAVHHAEPGEAGLERGELCGVAGRDGPQEPGGEPGEHLGEEGWAEVPAALEEGLGSGRDAGEEGLGALEGLVERLTESPGRPEDDGEPELDEGLQGPAALPFGGADTLEDGLAEGGGDVGAQKLQDADEIDRCRGRARLTHSPSFCEKVYGPSV
jgi:hypothetical protein